MEGGAGLIVAVLAWVCIEKSHLSKVERRTFTNLSCASGSSGHGEPK
jgi:hypothetical protein